ncbi:MAG: LamG-like jellyroll fold domain-containing protein [Promethearchaeota archaeon]
MNKLNIKTKKVISVTFLMILTISSIYVATPLNLSNSEEFNREQENQKELQPQLSQGDDPWWDASFQWRQCINITNSGSFNLEDNIIKIQFNWKNLADAGHLQNDLDDIRIVENGVLRNYYIKKDFPSANQATVWFETNSTAGSKDYDTYMYYGNSTVGPAASYYMANCPDGIARWEFEEGSGNMVHDSMSNLYHGTMFNMEDVDFIATPELQGDYAIYLDGTNEYIALNMSFNYNGPDPDYIKTTLPDPIYKFTASAWVKIAQDEGGWSILDFDRSEYFTFAAGTPGYRATDGHVEFDCANTAGNVNDMLGFTLIDDDIPPEWYHLVVTFDYSKTYDKKIYVNGILDREVDAWNGVAIGDPGETRFGYIGDGSESSTFNAGRNNYNFEGYLDDVRYFDYALSDNEIEWLANYYPLELTLLGEVERAATVTIIIKDADDRIVPNAEVSLWENSTHILTVDSTTYTQFTLADGSTEFSKVPFGSYNVTVNYTLYNGLDEKIVYDSRTGPGGELEFKGLFVSANITADLWTIDFEVDDWAGDPLDYGYVEVGNNSIPVIDTIPLDSAGKGTFRWVTTTNYNYSVYYNNPDYYTHPTWLNSSNVIRGVSSYDQYVRTAMSKLDIRVMDNTGTEPVTGLTIRVNSTVVVQEVVELETDFDGYAHGEYSTDFGFWYLNGQTYNFTLWFVNLPSTFTVNLSDKPKPPGITDHYEYLLDQNSSLIFWLDEDFTARIANFTSASGDTSVTWGENMTFSVLYESSNDTGASWYPDWNRFGYITRVTWTIYYSKTGLKLLELLMAQGSTLGTFTITVNSSLFSAANDYENYYVLITGLKPFWNDPEPVYFGITIYAKPTGLTLHDYDSMPDELPVNVGGDYETSVYYGYEKNITARFYDDNTNQALTPESFTYEWAYGSGTLMPGPSAGYYTFKIDTLDAPIARLYKVDISVNLENYTQFEDFEMYINILSRPTEINGESGLLYVSEDIYIFKEKILTFEYIDVFTSNPITNLDERSYFLQKLDADGDPIPGSQEAGSLTAGVGVFELDLNTETREDGEYSIIVTLDKDNYDQCIAIISLTIMKRAFGILLDIDKFVGSKIEIASGAALDFMITLTDPNNETVPNAPVIGATVYLSIENMNITFTDNGDGTYSSTPTVIANAFFMPLTFTAILHIEKQYFSPTSESLTVVVKMHETFGFPTFYLLMIVGAVVAVVGSLVAYRVIQRARIPTFVKKSREMKKDIKGKKSISDSLLYPSKEEYIVKKLRDKWEAIGLSLDDIMGIQKKKKLPEEFKEFKGGAE